MHVCILLHHMYKSIQVVLQLVNLFVNILIIIEQLIIFKADNIQKYIAICVANNKVLCIISLYSASE